MNFAQVVFQTISILVLSRLFVIFYLSQLSIRPGLTTDAFAVRYFAFPYGIFLKAEARLGSGVNGEASLVGTAGAPMSARCGPSVSQGQHTFWLELASQYNFPRPPIVLVVGLQIRISAVRNDRQQTRTLGRTFPLAAGVGTPTNPLPLPTQPAPLKPTPQAIV